jgi:hypothetical protein
LDTTVQRATLSKSKEEVDALRRRIGVLRAIAIIIWLRSIVVVRIASATAPIAAAASPVAAAVIVATAVIATSVIASTTSMVAAPTTSSAMTTATTAAMTTATTAAVGGVSRSYPEGANHEGKRDSRRQSGYPGTQCLFRLERYLHNDTASRDRFPLHSL